MGRNPYAMRNASAVALLACALNSFVQADYILTPLSGGLDEITVSPGDSFTLDLILSSNAGDTHLSSAFSLIFSDSGLMYESYSWGAGYTNGGIDDISIPGLGDLPTPITSSSYGITPDIDIYFENLTDDGQEFGSGTIISVLLLVPSGWTPLPDTVFISVLPDLFFDGFNPITTTAGPDFTLHIIPAPPCLYLLAIAGFANVSRRRR